MSTAPSGALTDVVDFLRAHAPCDALAPSAVEAVAASAQIEFHLAGATILSPSAEPVAHVRIVRSGAVELIHDGVLLDLLGPGELFGHSSMLSGLPAGFSARAHEDTLCYRIDDDVALAVLSSPETAVFVARSLLSSPNVFAADGSAVARRDPAHQPVGALMHGEPVVVDPETSIREAARLMTASGASAVIVRLPESVGIVTDRDLRTRVVAVGVAVDDPIRSVMTAPAYTVGPDRLGGGVLLEMLDRGIRHFPVISALGELLGVVEDQDLIAVETRNSFYVRRQISGAETTEELAAAARHIQPMLIALQDSRIAATSISSILSVVLDAVTRRAVEIAIEELGEPATPFAWLAMGSQARREAVPGSDLDSAIVWYGDADEAEVRPHLHEIAKRVVADLEACGLRPDAQGATAANVRFIRSEESWRHVARSWLEDPTLEKALILTSVLVDSRPVWGIHSGTPVAEEFGLAPQHPVLLRQLARFSLSYRPPTGFLRGLVVEHSGERRGQLDLKHGGIVPIVDLARWAAMSAGVTCTSTAERVAVAGEAGTLGAGDAATLREALELIVALRVEHQISQLRAGEPPDDYIDPDSLSSLTRSHLREAFRAVAAVQKRVAADLAVTSL
ncbi:MAG TPA: putative nucleotidyltransferase substrate binding domain-containing protein [Solirubrobacteraceae bacterium]|jgi:CBS domain-containing protein|nr:putative nucleotidyltransferase substrate binding domain-containing protein [Solirubrobacteraceae bacterium]